MFLNGVYQSKYIDLYRKLCRGKVTIAVDGGHRFFEKAGMAPQLLIGDLDSLANATKRIHTKTILIKHPSKKDKTDAQLALEWSLAQKPKEITIVQPSMGEPDHFLGNLMLLTLAEWHPLARYRPKIRIYNARHEIVLLHNATQRFDGCAGDLISVVAISDRIRLTCEGTAYDVKRTMIRRGMALSLRNRVVSKKAYVKVEGAGLVFHRRG